MVTNMKIAIVIPTLTLGGAEKIARDTALCFEKMGHDVTLILFKDKIEFPLPDRIETIISSNGLFSLVATLYKGAYDLCISYMERANLLTSFAAKLTKVEHIATVHTAPEAGFKLRSKKNQIAIFFTYKLMRFLNTKVVGVCKGIILDLKRKYGIDNSFVIPNFIDSAEVTQLADEDYKCCETYDFIFVGRLAKVKGCHIFIEALSGIQEELLLKNISVGIIGSGPDFNNIEELIESHNLGKTVKMLGAKKNPYPLIKNSKYIVVPSYAEGFGMVVLEGLLLGSRVIFSKCDFGPKEIIDENFRELESLGFADPANDPTRAITELRKIIQSELIKPTPFDAQSIRERIGLYYNPQKTCDMFLRVAGK